MARGNINNLSPIQSNEEARKKGSAGGKKSGEARRQKRLLKDTLEAMLEVKDKKGNTMQDAICIALFKRANCGDTKAFEIIRDTIGQKPVEKVETIEKPIINDDI